MKKTKMLVSEEEEEEEKEIHKNLMKKIIFKIRN